MLALLSKTALVMGILSFIGWMFHRNGGYYEQLRHTPAYKKLLRDTARSNKR